MYMCICIYIVIYCIVSHDTAPLKTLSCSVFVCQVFLYTYIKGI